ncbi:hypothetical protein [Luteimonas sp. FCS-9]|nr:hypothetical protein [Luteimonas sp. FCS-9]
MAIIGSANVEDRGLPGHGDTELTTAVVDSASEVRGLGNDQRVVTRAICA